MDNINVDVIKAEVIKILSELLEILPDEIETHMSLKDDLGADFLDAVYFIIALEDKYGFFFENDALQNYTAVDDFVKEIKGRLEQKKLMGKCISLRKYKSGKDLKTKSEKVQVNKLENKQGRAGRKTWCSRVL